MVGIKITDRPIKMTGSYSVLVKFDYDKRIKDLLESYPCYYQHKKKNMYEFPLCDLATLLDDLCKITDIELQMNDDYESSENRSFSNISDKPKTYRLFDTVTAKYMELTYYDEALTQEEYDSFKLKPFRHQIEAINYGLHRHKFLLLDGCGVGKTNEIIFLAEVLHKRKLIDHCLIICAVNSLKQNWKKEIKMFSNESVMVLGEKISKRGNISYKKLTERIEDIMKPIDEFFVIVNIESFRVKRGQTKIAGLADAIMNKKNPNQFDFIAIDESHHGTSAGADQMKEVLDLTSSYKVAATGTLITNNPLSAFTSLKFTDNDAAGLTTYKKCYCTQGGEFSSYQITGYQNLDLLRDEIESCSIRRTLDQVREDIPMLQIDYELVEMSDKDAEFYQAVKDGIKEEVNKIELNASNCLALTTRLRQATSCPSILTDKPFDSSKLIRCTEIVEEILSQNEKVVILGSYKESIYQLNRMLSEYNPLMATGDIKDDVCFNNMNKFQDKTSGYNVFLGTTDKLGTGFTLNSAMYLIFVDTPWTWSNFYQGYSRIYRVNNERPAFIKVLADVDTIDEKVWRIINEKKDLGDYLVDGKISENLKTKMREILQSL